jgi:hypothetical protein
MKPVDIKVLDRFFINLVLAGYTFINRIDIWNLTNMCPKTPRESFLFLVLLLTIYK